MNKLANHWESNTHTHGTCKGKNNQLNSNRLQNCSCFFSSKCSKDSGVTIISLIVIIIVLLILAMISFGMFKGENSLIKKVIQAQKMDSAEETRERVAVEALGSFDRRTGKLSSEKLKRNLKEHLGVQESEVQENEEGKYNFPLGEYDVEVNPDAEVNVLPKEEIQTPPILSDGDIRFIFDPSKLTNKEVLVTIQARSEINTVRLTLQYATSDPDNEESWQPYLEPITFQNNGPIYARIVNENNEKSNYVSDNVTNIDKQPPVITEFKVLESSITTNSLDAAVTASDDRQLKTKKAYQFFVEEDGEYKLNGTSSDGKYTYKGLKQGNNYKLKVVVSDEAGNTQESETQVSTNTIPDLNTGEESPSPTDPKKGNITFKYSYTEWNNYAEIKVTLELSEDIESKLEEMGLKLQYLTLNESNKEWQDYNVSGFKITKNGTIYARLVEIDGNQTSNSASSSYTKFDRKAPEITIEVEKPTAGTVKVNVVSGLDNPSTEGANDASGLVDENRYTYYLEEVGDTERLKLHSGNEESYIYEGLEQGKQYNVIVALKDKAGNIGEATSIVTTKVIPDLTEEGSVEVTYKPETWTNTNVRVNATSKYTEEGYILQYAIIPDNDEDIVWNEVPADGFDMEKNGKFKLRLKYQASQEEMSQYGTPIEKEVNWIDREKPSIGTNEEVTTNYIKVNIDAMDALSGIDEAEGSSPYEYYIFEGEITDKEEIENKLSSEEPKLKTNKKEYTFADLSQNTTYTIVVTAKDRALNVNYVTKVVQTKGVPGLNEGGLEQEGNITFIYSKTVWNNDEYVTVTLELSEELKSQVLDTQGGTATNANLTLQYSLDGEVWYDYKAEGFKITENGPVHAKLVDSSNQTGGTATSNYNMFDRIPPTVDEISSDNFETTSTSIKVTVHATDGESGIKEYRYYLDEETEENLKAFHSADPDNPNTDSFTFDDLEKYSSHTVIVKVIDNATNESKVLKKIVKGVELKEGDYVNYVPDSESEEYISEAEHNGYQDQTFKRKTIRWRVLSIDQETGEIKLISDAFGADIGSVDSETITYKGAEGYNNAVKDLNDLCKTLFGHTYAIVRSLNLDEFTNKVNTSTDSGSVSAQSPSIWKSEISGGGKLGQNDQDIWYNGTGEMTNYTNNAYECNIDSSSLLYNSNSWVAARSFNATGSNYQFGIHDADTDLSYQTLFDGSNGTESTVSKAIRAIAIIPGSIQYKSNGDPSTPEGSWDIAWNNEIDEDRFYFNATTKSDAVTFERTENKSDYEDILTMSTKFDLIIHNNNGTDYNASYPTTYQISMVDNPKFELEEGSTISKTIEGGEKKDDIITLNLKIKDIENPQNSIKIIVTSLEPYSKTIELNLKVVQKGAIQTVEDLVNFSLAVRGRAKNELTKEEAETDRFKLTRDLDFQSNDSYENAERTDFGDINLDKKSGTLKSEVTTNAGFLPIGVNTEYSDESETTGKVINCEFRGTFNGGYHTISNLFIEKALQNNIAFFGVTINANIRNFTIKSGNVRNHNQTAGMIVGKAQGGTIENINIESGNVLSLDETIGSRDTYAGGIAGYVERNVTIKNCVNKASVTTQFTGNATDYSGPAGGIVAWMSKSTIESCINYGKITGQRYIGGIVGFSAMQDSEDSSDYGGEVKNCHNYGTVTTYITTSSGTLGMYLGGIAGYNKATGIVDSCTTHAEASVKGVNYIGGIVGGNYGTIKNCVNSCTDLTATGGSRTGGIYGYNSSSTGHLENNTGG